MAEFNKDDYLNDLPDADDLAGDAQAVPGQSGTQEAPDSGNGSDSGSASTSAEAAASGHAEGGETESKGSADDAKAESDIWRPCSVSAPSSSTTATAPRKSRNASASTASLMC